MILHDVWQQDRGIEEAPQEATRLEKKYWGENTSKACLSLSGFNTDEMYAYTIYMSYGKPGNATDMVKNLVAKAPGSIKHIRLRFYQAGEKDPLDDVQANRPFSNLRADLLSSDEEIKRMVLGRIDAPMKEKVSAGKRLVVGYDVKLKLVVTDGSTKITLAVSGNITPDMDKRLLSLATSFGEVKGYEISPARELEIVNVEERRDSIFAFVIVNPSRKE
jgi:hypothetical protein